MLLFTNDKVFDFYIFTFINVRKQVWWGGGGLGPLVFLLNPMLLFTNDKVFDFYIFTFINVRTTGANSVTGYKEWHVPAATPSVLSKIFPE